MTGVSLCSPLKVWLLILSHLVLVLKIGSSSVAQAGLILKVFPLDLWRAKITGGLVLLSVTPVTSFRGSAHLFLLMMAKDSDELFAHQQASGLFSVWSNHAAAVIIHVPVSLCNRFSLPAGKFLEEFPVRERHMFYVLRCFPGC